MDSDVALVVHTEESRQVVIAAVVNTDESSKTEIAPVLLSESSSDTTVTAEVDVTYPETGDVQFEDETGHDSDAEDESFDKALQHSRMVILKKRTEEYIHRHDITKGRKKFMSNASHRLKIKLLDSKIKTRTRNRTKPLRDRHFRKESVIQVAASIVNERQGTTTLK
jgi:hypothetical protein